MLKRQRKGEVKLIARPTKRDKREQWAVVKQGTDKNQEAYSQYFIFFVTQELSGVFFTSKPFQLCYRTVQLIGPIRKLRRKWSAVNTIPGGYSQIF